VFTIIIKSGVRIKHFSLLGSMIGAYLQPFGSPDQDEDEVLLRPGTKFMIDAINRHANGITEVVMHEVGCFMDQLALAAAAIIGGPSTATAQSPSSPSTTGAAGVDHGAAATSVSSVPAIYHFADPSSSGSSSTDGGTASTNIGSTSATTYIAGVGVAVLSDDTSAVANPLNQGDTAGTVLGGEDGGTSDSANGGSSASAISSPYIAGFDLPVSMGGVGAPVGLEGHAAEEGDGASSAAPSSSYITGLELASSTPPPNNRSTANVERGLKALAGDDADGTRL
jgi:hypothetical protein